VESGRGGTNPRAPTARGEWKAVGEVRATELQSHSGQRQRTTRGHRHLHVQERGKIVFFRIQYETRIDEQWHPVVRYDTAHGFAHRDLLGIDGSVVKTPLFNQDFNDALTFAESDLKTNWEHYRKRFLGGKDG